MFIPACSVKPTVLLYFDFNFNAKKATTTKTDTAYTIMIFKKILSSDMLICKSLALAWDII